MITTQTLPYRGSKTLADELNRESARHYNAVLANHWRTFARRVSGSLRSPLTAGKTTRRRAPSCMPIVGTLRNRLSTAPARQHGLSSATGTPQRDIPSIAEHSAPRSGRTPASARTAVPCCWLGRVVWLQSRCRSRQTGSPAGSWKRAWSRQEVLQVRLAHGARRRPRAASRPGDRVWRSHGRDSSGCRSGHRACLVLSCRALRACKQYGNKRRSELAVRDRAARSNNKKRIQKRMNRFKAQQERRERDILHKV